MKEAMAKLQPAMMQKLTSSMGELTNLAVRDAINKKDPTAGPKPKGKE